MSYEGKDHFVSHSLLESLVVHVLQISEETEPQCKARGQGHRAGHVSCCQQYLGPWQMCFCFDYLWNLSEGSINTLQSPHLGCFHPRFQLYYCDKQFLLIINLIVGWRNSCLSWEKIIQLFQWSLVCSPGLTGWAVFPQNSYVEILSTSTSDVTRFGDKDFTEVMKLDRGHQDGS